MLEAKRNMKRLAIRILRVRDVAACSRELRARTAMKPKSAAGVRAILDAVAERGDRKLIEFTRRFDGVRLDSIRVGARELESACSRIGSEQLRAIRMAKRNLEAIERTLMARLRGIGTSVDGIRIAKLVRPLDSVGCYVPGGKARYPSSVVMCVVPAAVACVPRIVVCTPPGRDGCVDPITLAACRICGAHEVYRVGGPQAIAAMAYGTGTIRPVAKIVGPGGALVTIAKHFVSDTCAIDMLAGPSELVVLADESADPRLVAHDLAAQAEHSEDTFCGLVTDSAKLAARIAHEIPETIRAMPRRETIRRSLAQNGFIAVCRNIETAVRLTNELAAEHVEVLARNAARLARKVTCAGVVLAGRFAPVAAADYCLGSNHVLPTMGSARARGGLSCLDFVKISGLVTVSRRALERIAPAVESLSEAEGLPAHGAAVRARLQRFR
ncbi:MAG: histidinol dehydrogenase [Planctomycetota bacterium]|nr:histidinol dehydrogenase [Planctomycetota bacterium]